MSGERLFLDTVYIQALLNKRDQYHARARLLLPRVRAAREVWVSEAVLLEVANALCAINRAGAIQFIRQCYQTGNMRVVPLESALLLRGLDLYDARPDKIWSLTDCISFIIMEDHGLREAVTTDGHFQQAGFRALLLEQP